MFLCSLKKHKKTFLTSMHKTALRPSFAGAIYNINILILSYNCYLPCYFLSILLFSHFGYNFNKRMLAFDFYESS